MKSHVSIFLTVILASCGAGDQIILPRAAVVNGNLEVIGDGLEAFLGHDSSGSLAIDYVKPFAQEVEKIYFDYRRSLRPTVGDVGPPSSDADHQLALLSQVNPANSKPPEQTQPYVNRLDGIARIASLKMDSCYDAYLVDGRMLNAKKAFAAGFYALQGRAYGKPIREKMTQMYDSIAAHAAVARASD